MSAPGTLYGLGLGPGDPELLTLRAHRILRAVPVIAYPAANEAESFARRIAAPHLPGGQEEIAFPIAMSADRAPGRAAYDAAAPRIAAHLEAGRDVAVLCEGDPFFYGSFLYLFVRLGGRFPAEVVPGVSSVMAAAAALGRPLAARGDTFAVLPATLPDEALRRGLEAATSVAILKLGRHFTRVRALLRTMGLEGRALYAERVTLPGQRLLPLADTDADADGAAPYFAMILVYRGEEPAILGTPA